MKAILDWFEKNSTFITLIIVIIYVVMRLTGYFTPTDYKLNYISAHTNETITETYIFIRAITGFLAVIGLSILLYRTYK
jgi:ascorbate-specific PTS system EIIC-type component UlaA